MSEPANESWDAGGGLGAGRLEQRYRRLLCLLPASYRRAWEEDMVSTFLASLATGDREADKHAANFGWPGWPEIASVARLAIRLRTDKPGHTWGAAIRLVALIGLLANAVGATQSVGTLVWLSGHLPWLPPPRAGAAIDAWFVVSLAASIVWIPAYLAMLDGSRRLGTLLAVLAFAGSGLYTVVGLAGGAPWVLSHSSLLILDAALVAALVAFHDDTPPVWRRPWLIAWPVGIGVVLSLTALDWPTGDTRPWLDWPAECCLAVIAAGAVHLAVPRARRNPAWSHALALLAVGTFLLRALTLLDYALAPRAALAPSPTLPGVVEAIAVLVVGLSLAVRASRGHHLPPPSAPTTAQSLPW
jgi:hypothetical protein